MTQITEQNIHKLPNEIATNYRICKINLRILKKSVNFATALRARSACEHLSFN
jgi:hypothetical protein